jgi:hypothetical protein
MQSSLDNLYLALSAFQQSFKSPNHLGCRSWVEFHNRLDRWRNDLEMKHKKATIFHRLLIDIDYFHAVVPSGRLPADMNYRSNIVSVQVNGQDDYELAFNLALDGFFADLSSILDYTAHIANGIMFKRVEKEVGFLNLAVDCGKGSSTFENLIVDNTHFSGNQRIESPTWINIFRDLRHTSVHRGALYTGGGSLLINSGPGVARTTSLSFPLPKANFVDLPATQSHDLKVYVELLFAKLNQFLPTAFGELQNWLLDQKKLNNSIPRF